MKKILITSLTSLCLVGFLVWNYGSGVLDFAYYYNAIQGNHPVISCQTLITIPVQDNGEPLVIVQQQAPEIICEYVLKDMIPYVGEKMLVRKSVAQRLTVAAKTLTQLLPGARLKLAYGYRNSSIQKEYFDATCARFKRLFVLPMILGWVGLSWTWLDQQVLEFAHLFAAYPAVAGHPTGGAVDITIVVPSKNDIFVELDMGGTVDDFLSKMAILPTFSSCINVEQQKNRCLLRHVMADAGFAPFNGEWWHFSYGDKEWAAYYQKSYALYNQINEKNVL